jgi:5-methylcytosine-specific restriction endonuclease McrA
VDQWLIRTDPEHVRRLLFKKEQGICQQCQLDTEALKKQAHQVAMEQRRVPLSERHWWRHAYSFTKVVLEVTIHGQQEIPLSRTLWEADHIVPVVEGGGACGLENYRTLCYWCHKLVTKAMHARRALERRQQKHAAQIT